MDDMKELSYGELSALCSNLARACQKQQLFEEEGLFRRLASYYTQGAEPVNGKTLDDIQSLVKGDLESGFGAAISAAEAAHDRGAKRSLTWAQKTTALLDSLLTRYEKQGDALLEKTNVWVCEICGFIFVGDVPPEVCPICKVPRRKIMKVG